MPTEILNLKKEDYLKMVVREDPPTHVFFHCKWCETSWVAREKFFYTRTELHHDVFYSPCPTCKHIVTKYIQARNKIILNDEEIIADGNDFAIHALKNRNEEFFGRTYSQCNMCTCKF
jgi:hypothetical protein